MSVGTSRERLEQNNTILEQNNKKIARAISLADNLPNTDDNPALKEKLFYILGYNQMAFNILKQVLCIEQEYTETGGTPDEICAILNTIIGG